MEFIELTVRLGMADALRSRVYDPGPEIVQRRCWQLWTLLEAKLEALALEYASPDDSVDDVSCYICNVFDGAVAYWELHTGSHFYALYALPDITPLRGSAPHGSSGSPGVCHHSDIVFLSWCTSEHYGPPKKIRVYRCAACNERFDVLEEPTTI